MAVGGWDQGAASVVLAVGLLVSLGGDAPGSEGEWGRLVASREPGWPQWRGPRRDGISDEKGLLEAWPEGGPKLLWTAAGLGLGYSSPIITRGSLYITGDVGQELHVFALDLEGKLKWRSKNGQAWRANQPGARGSCTYDDGRLYHMNAHGRLACLDATSGKELWAVNVLERFTGKPPFWGLSESPLVDGSRVIVTPGGEKALMAALDAKTGETVWATEPLVFERRHRFGGGQLPAPTKVADQASYASAILFELGGRRHVVACSGNHAFGVDPHAGKLLWVFPMVNQWDALATTPVLHNDSVFVTGPDGRGGKLLRLRAEGASIRVEEVWTTEMDALHGGVVAVGDLFVGPWYRSFNGWGCIDAATGQTLHRTREVSKGSLIYADERLYYLSEQGAVLLAQPALRGFEVTGRFTIRDGRRNDVWAHPVICDGRLYLRYHERLYCYDIKSGHRSSAPNPQFSPTALRCGAN